MGTVEAIDDEVLSIWETLSKNNCLLGIYTNKYLKEKLNVYYLNTTKINNPTRPKFKSQTKFLVVCIQE